MKNLNLILGICLMAFTIFFSSCGKEEAISLDTTVSALEEESTQNLQKYFNLEGYGELEIGKAHSLETIKGTGLYKFINENFEKNSTNYVFGANRTSGQGYYAIKTPYPTYNSSSLVCHYSNTEYYQTMHPNNFPTTSQYKTSGKVSLDLYPGYPDPNSNNTFDSGYAFIAIYSNNNITIKGVKNMNLSECKRLMSFKHILSSNSYVTIEALYTAPCNPSS